MIAANIAAVLFDDRPLQKPGEKNWPLRGQRLKVSK
jgi:hypothetical protein